MIVNNSGLTQVEMSYMTTLKNQLRELVKSNEPPQSILYWNSILNFFSEHHLNLDIDDLKTLWAECVRCCVYFNQERDEVVPVRTKNGVVELRKIRKAGMGIDLKDISPNIYLHLQQRLEPKNTQ